MDKIGDEERKLDSTESSFAPDVYKPQWERPGGQSRSISAPFLAMIGPAK